MKCGGFLTATMLKKFTAVSLQHLKVSTTKQP